MMSERVVGATPVGNNIKGHEDNKFCLDCLDVGNWFFARAIKPLQLNCSQQFASNRQNLCLGGNNFNHIHAEKIIEQSKKSHTHVQ